MAMENRRVDHMTGVWTSPRPSVTPDSASFPLLFRHVTSHTECATAPDRPSALLTLYSDTNLFSHPPTSPRECYLVSQSHVYMCVSAVIT